jgi:hypothetical protein
MRLQRHPQRPLCVRSQALVLTRGASEVVECDVALHGGQAEEWA